MIVKLRRGLSAFSAWAALFAVAGVAYAARRRAPARSVPAAAESVSAGTSGADDVDAEDVSSSAE